MKSMLLLSFAIVLALSHSRVQGQWIQTGGPAGGNISSIATGPAGMFAAARGGGVFRSTTNGTRWTAVTNNLSSTYVSLLLLNGSDLYAVTTDSGIFRSTSSGSVWAHANSGLGNLLVNSLVQAGSVLYAAIGNYGSTGYVYRSTNSGATWTPVNGSPWPTTPVTAVAQIDTHLFAGTNGAGVWHAANSTWQAVNAGLGNSFVRCMATLDSTLYAGTSGGIYRSTNRGSQWSAANGGLSISVVEFLVASGSDLYAKTNLGLLRTTNGGTNWTTVPTPSNPAAFAANGTTLSAATRFGISVSTNAGGTWTEHSAGLATGNAGQLFPVGNSLFAADAFYQGGGALFRSTDAGATWDSTNTGLPYNFVPTSFAILGSTILCTETMEGVYASTDNGDHWTARNSGFGISKPSALAVQNSLIFAGDHYMMYMSSDTGASWNMINSGGLPGGDIGPLIFHGTTLFVGYSGFNGYGLYASTDAGVNWAATNSGLAAGNARIIYALATNGSTLFAGTEDGMYRSTDNGATWQSSGTGLPAGRVSAVSAPGTTILAGTLQGAFLSTDNGVTWGRTDARRSIALSFALNGTDVFTGFSNGGVWRYTAPATIPVAFASSPVSAPGLTQFPSQGPGPGVSMHFASLAGSGIVSVARFITAPAVPAFSGTPPANVSSYRWVMTQNGLSSFSVELRFTLSAFNGGITNPGGVTVYHRAMPGSGSFSPLATTYDAPANELRATVSSFSEFIFGSNNNPLSDVQEQGESPLGFMLEQNYPNPFNPTTVIRYQVPGVDVGKTGSGWVRLSVYDMLGREVAVLVNEEQSSGNYAVPWNARQMASGAYCYQLRIGQRTETRRLMLLR